MNLLGRLYAFLYYSQQRRFIFRVSALVRYLPLVAAFAYWWLGGAPYFLYAALLWALFVHLLYWRARKDGYIRFLDDGGASLPAGVEPLPANQKVPVRATGIFSVVDREAYVLERPAEYWRVPLNDHIVMVQQQPGRFLYQMFQAATLHEIKPGRLLFGVKPRPALAIRFTVTWGPEFTRYERTTYPASSNGHDGPAGSQRWIYLTFDDDAGRLAVWRTVGRDLGGARPS
jgi:hypothetical protein